MAKRSTRRQKEKALIWRLEVAAAVVLVGLTLIITFWGGLVFGGVTVPTWEKIFQWFKVSSLTPAPLPVDGETQVHFIDVGQGDAVLIASGGEYALIDCGTEECELQLLTYLQQVGVARLKLLVMTHPHADHIGSMDAVLRRFAVDTLLLPDLTKAAEYPTTACFENVLAAAAQNGCAVRQAAEGESFAVGQGSLTVLSTGLAGSEDHNNISLCTRFTAGEFSFVNTGDAEQEVENTLLLKGPSLASTLFKAAHHGSETSNTLPFLALLHPDVVVVSCGRDNSYGHPHQKPMQRYAAVGADVYRTDQNGSVVVSHSAQNGLQVYLAKEANAA